jgi:hypothetical protein
MIIPPGVSVWDAMMKAEEGLAVMIETPIVTLEGGGVARTRALLPPMMREAPFAASEYAVPEYVIIPPGVRVWDAIMKADEGLAVIIEPPMVASTGAVGRLGVFRLGVFVCVA